MSYDVRTVRQLGRLSPVQLQQLLVEMTGSAVTDPRRGNPIHCRTMPGDAGICRVMGKATSAW